VSTIEEVWPGDIMFARHLKPWYADLLVQAGQLALGEPGYPHHVGVVVQGGFKPRIVQAMPGGAEEIEIGAEYFTKDYVYVRPEYRSADRWPDVPVTQAEVVAESARCLVGTPYSFLDYVALAGLHLGVKNGRVRRYVRDSGHMICSQLADQAMTDAGYHVFNDKRLPQDVIPSALFRQLLSLPGQHRAGPDARWTTNRP
jgi:hypothetical protein